MHEGQVVFSDSRNEILDRWGVIKADEQTLRGEVRPLLRGVRHGAHGCEALTSDIEAARALLPAKTVVEKASLDDIVVLLQSEED